MTHMQTTSARATDSGRFAPWWTGALSGVLAAAAGVAVATGVAALMSGVPSPVVSIGNRAIDMTPRFLKEFAVRTFGESDKPVLLGGMVATLVVVAAVAGWIGLRRPRVAYGIFITLGLLALGAATLDRTATASRALTLIPALVTLVVSLGMLVVLLRALELAPKVGDEVPDGFNRRAFLRAALGASAGIILGGVVAKFLGTNSAADSRRNHHPSRAGRAGPGRPRRCPGRRQGHQQLHHAEPRLLPRRHGPDGAQGAGR